MKKTYQSFLLCLMIAALLVSGLQIPQVQAESDQEVPLQAKALTDTLNLLEKTYTEKLKEWSEVPHIPDTNIIIAPTENKGNASFIVSKQDSFGYGEETLRWKKDTEITFDIHVENTGLYQLAFDYYMIDESILPTEGYLKINGDYPFYESRHILFPSKWENIPLTEKWDRYGNELLPRSQKLKQWQSVYAMDSSYFHMEPLLFKLEKGPNTVTLVNTRGEMLLGKVRVETPAQIETYDNYVKSFPAEEEGAELSETLLIIEAEQPLYKNDSSIRAASARESRVFPYNTSKLLLNMIDAGSYEEGGQSLTWELDAPQDGYYHISLKYLQDKQYDLPVFRRIELDGAVPFRELDNYAFHYTKKWRNETLGTDEKPYQFYLTKGKHTLSMTVNLSNMRPLAEDIFVKMKEISRMTLEIKKLTGNKSDQNRDWNLLEYMPDLTEQLNSWADDLDQRFIELNALNPKVKEIGEIVNLKLASKQLRTLAKDPDELPNRLNLFSEGSSSAAQLLGTLLQNISESPLALDRIYVHQEGKLPAPNAGFFEKLWEAIKRFFYFLYETIVFEWK